MSHHVVPTSTSIDAQMPNGVAETFVPGTVRDRLQRMLISNLIGSQRGCATAVCQLASILPCLSEGIGLMDSRQQNCYETASIEE